MKTGNIAPRMFASAVIALMRTPPLNWIQGSSTSGSIPNENAMKTSVETGPRRTQTAMNIRFSTRSMGAIGNVMTRK
ncbi:hypothetical protein D3C85_1702480 [compost metagenome]